MQLSYSMITDPGSRPVNEDCMDACVDEKRAAFVLCDGLGGHGNGDTASQFAVGTMMECLRGHASVEEAIMQAQNGLLELQRRENAQRSMKTTVTCLEIAEGKARFGHVGDSRVYYFEKNRLKQRSIDHSIPQMLAIRGDIRESQIRHHEDRSRLLRVLGTPWDRPKYTIVENIPVTSATTFLLCSDGFWELIEDRQMCRLLRKSQTPEAWLEKMEQVVRMNGQGTDMDNYSAIAVFVRN